MITFYPGPSKVYPEVADYAAQAVREGVVSLNHRSAGFMDIVKETIGLLHEKLAIPADYHIAFVSSATECWEIVAQSLTAHHRPAQPVDYQPHYFYMGAFGKKWYEGAADIGPSVYGFGWKQPARLSTYYTEGEPDDENVRQYRRAGLDRAELVCLVQNETSNGSQITMDELAWLRQHTRGLVCVDAVSSMAGVAFNWALADVWFASVQKCFGLPAGLAVLIYGPNALSRAEQIGERQHYNSLLFIHENIMKFQTQYTPNGLGIYCLMRVMQQVPPIADVAQLTRQRAAAWYRFFEHELATSPWRLLIDNPDLRSDTVIAVQSSEAAIKAIKADAQQAGITLGNGYGAWKDTTFRVANFPAITDSEIEKLKSFLRHYPYKAA